MRTVIVCNVQIGDPYSDVATLNRFLFNLECDHLVLAGNIFDLRFSTIEKIKVEHVNTFAIIRRLKDKICYMKGLCDAGYKRKMAGIPACDEARLMLPDGTKIAIAPYRPDEDAEYEDDERFEEEGIDLAIRGLSNGSFDKRHSLGKSKKMRYMELPNWRSNCEFMSIDENNINLRHVRSVYPRFQV